MAFSRGKKTLRWILVLALISVLCWAGYRFFVQRTAAPELKKDPREGDLDRFTEENAGREGVLLKDIVLHYLGHASFLLEVGELRILMDPFSPQVGYGLPAIEADIITISHEHMDHNYTEAAGKAKILRGLTADGLGWENIAFAVGDVSITSIPTYHDQAAGKLRGRNAAFIFDLGALRLVHLGDLGHPLSASEIEKISPVDVLLIPVGGHYTIDALEARQVVEQLVPAVVIPMHYRTKVTRNWPISDLGDFLEGEEPVQQKGAKPVALSRDVLPASTEIWLLEPVKSLQ